MRVLVTGASGFLGYHLIQALDNRGHETITAGRSIDRIVKTGEDFDAVIHLAAQTEVGKAVLDPVATFEGNVAGTWRVLEFCRTMKIGRVLVASTDKAFGRSVAPYNENTPLLPDRPYETSKACVDLIARTYAATYGMSVAVTRCVNLYGPRHMNFSTLIPGTIKRVLWGERPIIRNGGRMKRDFLFVDDAVEGYIRLLESDYVGPMNFGTGKGYSIGYVSRLILKLLDSDLEPIDEPDKHGEIVDQWSDYTRADLALGWQPVTTLEQGLRKTVDWYKAYFSKAKSV